MHIDIWVDGVNYFRDSGTYKYNTTEEYLNYFNGTSSHNTVSVDNKNQMLKGKDLFGIIGLRKQCNAEKY